MDQLTITTYISSFASRHIDLFVYIFVENSYMFNASIRYLHCLDASHWHHVSVSILSELRITGMN